jgi:hypothetical protein
VRAPEIQSQILSRLPELLAAEITVSPNHEVFVHGLFESPTVSSAFSFSRAQTEALQQAASEIVPLSHSVRSTPFQVRPIQLHVFAELALDPLELSRLDPSALEARLLEESRRLFLPLPFGRSVVGRQVGELEWKEALRNALEACLSGSQRPQAKVRAFRVQAVDKNSCVLSEVARQAGECFLPQVVLKVGVVEHREERSVPWNDTHRTISHSI